MHTNGLEPRLLAPGQHHAEFVQQTAQRVDRRRAHAHPVLPRAVQRHHRLLLDVLDRHAPDVRLLRRQPDRTRIGSVVLVAAHERPHLARGQQLHLVTQAAQHTRPVVRAAARFHHHTHRLQPREVLGQLGPSELLAPDLASLAINPVQLHHVLCNVQAIRRTIHFGASVSRGCLTQHHFGTRCRRLRGPTFLLHKPYSRPSRSASASVSGWEASIPSPERMPEGKSLDADAASIGGRREGRTCVATECGQLVPDRRGERMRRGAGLGGPAAARQGSAGSTDGRRYIRSPATERDRADAAVPAHRSATGMNAEKKGGQ